MNGNLTYQEEPREELLNGKIYMMSSPTINHSQIASMISVFLWKKYSETYFNNERGIEKDKTACTVCENNVRGYCTK